MKEKSFELLINVLRMLKRSETQENMKIIMNILEKHINDLTIEQRSLVLAEIINKIDKSKKEYEFPIMQRTGYLKDKF
ncbi:MAG: hypothetical protein HY831_00940 [Candidatus Aenigmarchaeota archaeon]|nr:hypothetical protein [Candidatus Aenigmarchaeota archaeon]